MMDRKDYISDNLRKIKPQLQENAIAGVILPDINETKNAEVSNDDESLESGFNKAQERRLSDVYKAKLDIVARISKSLNELKRVDDDVTRRIAERHKVIEKLTLKLEQAHKLVEPETTRELLNYIREVEHLRMDFFTYEAELDSDLGEGAMALGKANSVDVKYFYKLSKLFTILLAVLIVAIIIGSSVIAVAILWAMKF